jgi:hypothetical protein
VKKGLRSVLIPSEVPERPYASGTFPRSREPVAKVFAGIAEADAHKMVIDNAMRLYDLA